MKYLLAILLTLSLNTTSYADNVTLKIKPSAITNDTQEEKEPTIQNKKSLVVVASSGDLKKAGMGFSLSLGALENNIETTIILGADALHFAQIKGKQNLFIAKNMTNREILKKAVESGAKVYVCSMCAKAMGLEGSDFIKGAKLVKSKEIFKVIYKENSKVLSF